jgi:hypothetical protein
MYTNGMIMPDANHGMGEYMNDATLQDSLFGFLNANGQ